MLAVLSPVAHAFKELTPAQKLIYDHSHLANTIKGQSLIYQYTSKSQTAGQKNDRITLSINQVHNNDKRDVVLDFLSGEQRMPFPDFNEFRGNPIIIAMLEHIAQSIGSETGGGVLYFRNRIRDALAADSILLQDKEIIWDGNPVQSTRLVFSPFLNDAYLAERPEYKYSEFSIVLSDEVPGSIVGISVESQKDGLVYFSRGLELDASGT